MISTFPVLQTQRLLLRQITENDIEHIFHGLSHPDVIKYYGVSFHSLEATQEQMDWYSALESKATGTWWAICSADGVHFYGAAGFNNLSREHRKAEIGFWLLPENWGKGIMVEALSPILRFGFEQWSLNRIEAFVETENAQCKSLMHQMNFQHEGTLTNCEVKNGEYISLDMFGLMR